jgi:molybdate transport system substrate-binding protein
MLRPVPPLDAPDERIPAMPAARPRRPFTLLLGTGLLALLSGACAPEGGAAATAPAPAEAGATTAPAPVAAPVTLNVFAAASLTDAFRELGAAFADEHPGVKPEFNFAGSQQLATQIVDGAPADVFASANQKQMAVAVQAGEVVSGTEQTFAGNRLVVVVPAANRAGLQGLADLAKPGVKVVLAAKAVPVGAYALEFLKQASAQADFTPAFSPTVMANVVSFEDDVTGVLGKVAQDEADAGIVYTSDLSGAVAEKLDTLPIPDELNVLAAYPIAALAHAPNPDLARAFVEFVRSPAGQAVLIRHGFLPAPTAP